MALQPQRTSPFGFGGGGASAPMPGLELGPILQRMTALSRGNLPQTQSPPNRMGGMPAPTPFQDSQGGGGLGGLANMIGGLGPQSTGGPTPTGAGIANFAAQAGQGALGQIAKGMPAAAPMPGFLSMLQGLAGG